MKKVVLLIGSCKFNKGSEAMVRGCIKMLRKASPNIYLVLSSRDDNSGNSLEIENVDKFVRRFTYNRNNKFLRYFIGVLRYILHLKHITNWINHHTLYNECKDADLVIVIGGDNYDKAYGMLDDMHSFHKSLKKVVTGKMVLLNCSINPDEFDKKVMKDLCLFDYITAREEITYDNLKQYLPQKEIGYYPDIAFVMDPQDVELPACFLKGHVVGINLSPLILRHSYTNDKDLIIQEYCDIIDYIINDLDMQVLLIPHVLNNTDIVVLRDIYTMYKKNNKVYLLDNPKLNATQIKYIISKCHMYLGARTHSTIAAYSTGVPTLVLGYSVKSIGIARALFSTEEGYVVPIQKVIEKGTLLMMFKEFVAKRDNVEQILAEKSPEYVEKAQQYEQYFKRVLGEIND